MTYGPLLDSIRTLSWPARRRVAGTRTGAHASRLRGRAPELSEYRLYRQGDDPRDLDWKLLARSDRPFIRLADDRAIHETWFLLDASPSMAFPEATMAKWDCACALTVALTSIAQRAGDPVALIVPGASAHSQVAPTTRRDAVVVVEQALRAATLSSAAPLAPALSRVAPASRVVVITDLLGDEDALRTAAAAHFAGGGEVILLHVLSRHELELDRDLAIVQDPEAPRELRPVDTTSADAYQRGLDRWLTNCRQQWVSLGATYVRVVGEDEAAGAVRSVIQAVQVVRVG
ncbi:MAG: DUF58 domain-containing protein [Gemmatimonadaceae bacterium]